MTATDARTGSEATDPARAAFEALYRQSRDDVYGYVAGLLRDRTAAEEVTAQAFERAYRKAGRFDPDRGSRRAWLFGIARNAALDELRRRSKTSELSPDQADEDAAERPEREAELALRRASVRRAIGGLAGAERELIALKFFGGLSNREIADVLGVSESNVGTRLHRVITKLRRSCHEQL